MICLWWWWWCVRHCQLLHRCEDRRPFDGKWRSVSCKFWLEGHSYGSCTLTMVACFTSRSPMILLVILVCFCLFWSRAFSRYPDDRQPAFDSLFLVLEGPIHGCEKGIGVTFEGQELQLIQHRQDSCVVLRVYCETHKRTEG